MKQVPSMFEEDERRARHELAMCEAALGLMADAMADGYVWVDGCTRLVKHDAEGNIINTIEF